MMSSTWNRQEPLLGHRMLAGKESSIFDRSVQPHPRGRSMTAA